MAVDRAKLEKVLALVTSDNAGEALAAVRMAKAMVEREGLDFTQVVKAGLEALEQPPERPQGVRVEDAFRAYAGAFSEMARRPRKEPSGSWAARDGRPADGTMTTEFRLVSDEDDAIRFDVPLPDGTRGMAYATGRLADQIRAHAADHGSGAKGSFTFRKGRTAAFQAA